MNTANSPTTATPTGTRLPYVYKLLADPFTLAALALYGAALLGLAATPGLGWSALILGLGVLVLIGTALFATRRQPSSAPDVAQPRAEFWSLLIWYGLVGLLAILTLRRHLEVVNEFTNWLFLVLVPVVGLVLVRRRGPALRTLWRSTGLTRTGLVPAIRLAALIGLFSVPLLALVSPQQRAALRMFLQQPTWAVVAFLVSFTLALLTAGFVEEFFFRGLVQSRAAAYLGSEWRGILVASFLFGLFHLPMYYYSTFEPTHGNWVWALSSCIAELGMVGLLLGVLWARTHNLAASILVHALINALAMMASLRIGVG